MNVVNDDSVGKQVRGHTLPIAAMSVVSHSPSRTSSWASPWVSSAWPTGCFACRCRSANTLSLCSGRGGAHSHLRISPLVLTLIHTKAVRKCGIGITLKQYMWTVKMRFGVECRSEGKSWSYGSACKSGASAVFVCACASEAQSEAGFYACSFNSSSVFSL